MSLRNFCKKIYFTLYKRGLHGLTAPLRVLPDFIVIGVGRGGTTSLYHYLSQHPCIARAAYDELGFFDTNYELGINWYRSLFPTKLYARYVRWRRKHFMTFDVTPSYIRRPWVIERIIKVVPNVKLIVVLRNPVDRTYSHYNMGVNEGQERATFEHAIQTDMEQLGKNTLQGNDYFRVSAEKSYLARGFYAEQLKIWLQIFSRQRILIVSSEELATNTQQTLNQIFEFLGLPKSQIMDLRKQRIGRYTPMTPKTRSMLVKFFEPYNKQLYDLLGRKFDWDK